ncbi:MAG: acetate kinase, partial [Clostridia bacterium]|nr:acetate kinase [Clostridia bacterium]
GGLDCIVFTGGIGENDVFVRQDACEGLEYMGVKIDLEKNNVRAREIVEISTPDSKVKVLIIPTNEELAIARETKALVEA